jgi:sigma-E factor negative regulatory protein RseC
MLKEYGIVVAVNDNLAAVQTTRTSLCGQCSANQGCGTASISRWLGPKNTMVTVMNHNGAKVGDQVVIGLEEQALLKSSVLLYLIPLLGLFAGAIGYEMFSVYAPLLRSELFTILAGFVGLIAGLMWVRRITVNKSLTPVILTTETPSGEDLSQTVF